MIAPKDEKNLSNLKIRHCAERKVLISKGAKAKYIGGQVAMWNDNRKAGSNLQAEKITKEKKVIDMRAWLERKRETAKNVLTFSRRNFANNDQPPTVA
jgi:hypothetical protein